MNPSSIAYKINAGYVVLVVLLLIIGLISYVSVTRMLDDMKGLNSSISETRSDLQDAIKEMGALEQSFTIFEQSEAEFNKLIDIQDELTDSQQATTRIGQGLGEIEKIFATQSDYLESINKNVAVMVGGINEATGSIRPIILAAEEINTHILHSYIGFFNYLNEFVPDVDEPLSDIKAINEHLVDITKLLDDYKSLEQADNIQQAKTRVEAIRQNLRRYRRFMQDLGETTSTTQITELKEQLVPYGNKIISEARKLRDIAWLIASEYDKKSLDLASVASSSASQALEGSSKAAAETKEHVMLAQKSSSSIGELTQTLSEAVQGVTTNLSEMPEAVKQASDSIKSTKKSIAEMENIMQAMDSSTQGAENIRLLLIVACFIAVLFGLIIGFYIYQRLVLPLSRFTSGLHRAANADLTVTVDSRGTTGELKDLIKGVNRLISNFNKSLISMKQLAERVQISSRDLNDVSMETFTAMDDQQKRAMQISQATEEMTTTTQAIADNTWEANKKASEVDEMLQKGNLIIENMMTISEEMAHDLNLSAGRINELAQDSEEINSIIEIIRAVARQTKLLALNAAVEAARAGKHGRGFTVVAEEVKKLAQESASSISGIEEIIKNVGEKTTQALHEISTSVEKAGEHQARSQEVVGQLQEIGSSTRDLTEQISQITLGTEEQNRAFPTVASSIETITGTTRATTQQMENIYRQVNELVVMSEELLESINIYTVSYDETPTLQPALQPPTPSE